MNLTRLATLTLTLLLASVAFAGTPKPLPRKIFLAPVEMPKKPEIVGRGAIVAALLAGPVGAFAADGANQDIEATYAEHLAKHHIDVGADLAFEIMNQLAARQVEVVGSPEKADATLQVIVANYGLAARGKEGSVPFLTTHLILRDRAGKKLDNTIVIWSIVKEFQRTVEPRPVPDYFANPQLLMEQMRRANTAVIREGLGKLSK